MIVSVNLFRLQRCLAIISMVWLAGIFCGLAQEANGEDSLSSSEAITACLKAVRKELAELPAETADDQRESLRQLEASTDSQLTALDLLAAAQDKLAKAKQASASSSGFPQLVQPIDK